MAQETVLVPDIGGSDAAEVVEILVSVGDSVDIDQGLLVLESDKASMEIPSTVAGTVVEVLAKDGDQLAEGAAIAVIEVSGAASKVDAAAGESVEKGANQGSSKAESVESSVSSSGPTDTPPVASQSIDVPVPDIGTDDAVDLIELSVAVGDSVSEGDTLVVLETDKASMEVPSPASGVVTALRVDEGQQVKQGDVLMMLEISAESKAEKTSEKKPENKPENKPQTSGASAVGSGAGRDTAHASKAAETPAATKTASSTADQGKAKSAKSVYAGPAVRRLAREFGVPLDSVKSSGPRGRILKEDLHEYVSRALATPEGGSIGTGIPTVPVVDFAEFGPVEVVERSKIDKVTAANMHRSWLNVPHVTQFDDADITEMEAFRKSLKPEAEKRGTRLTPLPFLLKACAVALKRNEKINASLSDGGTTLTYKRYVHIGMAVDTPAGLVVPVIRDVDQKTLWELADEVIELAGKARDRKLKPKEMQGGGFTISSLGSIGGRGFTPIVNAPEVAILGVSRADTQPVWDGSAFQPRLQLPLGLSYDHRVVNGGDAGRFLTELCQLLGDIRKLLL